MPKKLILISNDDGIQAEGIRTLAEHLQDVGDVWVVAPDREQSATSHSISLHKPLRLKQEAPQWFCVDGTPTDAVYMALHHVLPRRPDIVVSGINHGPNLGNDVLYSGTVSAAMEGALFGHAALALSLCISEKDPVRCFSSAASVARDMASALLLHPLPVGVLLNVNVPNLPLDALKGTRMCRLGHTDWLDAVCVRHDPRHKPYYWIGGERVGPDNIHDSDNTAVAEGFVAITPVHSDLTDYRAFAYTQAWDVPVCPIVRGEAPKPDLKHSTSARGMRKKTF